MTARAEQSGWRVMGECRRGAAHVRSGLRNQDALEYWVSAQSDTIVLAVADGHGSELFFRSDVGSRLAVETAVRVLRDFAVRHSKRSERSSILESAERELPVQLTGEWRKAVQSHVKSQPIGPRDWSSLSDEANDVRKQVERDPTLVYGSTVLAALVTNAYVLYLQLGDGDVLKVDESGKTERALGKDDRLIANQTFSLCQPDAAKEVRIRVDSDMSKPPVLILLSTDGYSNSFVSDDDFLKIGSDYLHIIRSDGMDAAERDLARFLDETSANGSGDDVTLGLISRTDRDNAAALMDPEEEVPVAVAAKLTAELDEARKRIDALDSEVSSLSGRIRWLQIALAISLVLALVALAFSAYRLPRSSAPPSTPAAAVSDQETPNDNPQKTEPEKTRNTEARNKDSNRKNAH
jgi:serine/threonine protein phosphatase PrpC